VLAEGETTVFHIWTLGLCPWIEFAALYYFYGVAATAQRLPRKWPKRKKSTSNLNQKFILHLEFISVVFLAN